MSLSLTKQTRSWSNLTSWARFLCKSTSASALEISLYAVKFSHLVTEISPEIASCSEVRVKECVFHRSVALSTGVHRRLRVRRLLSTWWLSAVQPYRSTLPVPHRNLHLTPSLKRSSGRYYTSSEQVLVNRSGCQKSKSLTHADTKRSASSLKGDGIVHTQTRHFFHAHK